MRDPATSPPTVPYGPFMKVVQQGEPLPPPQVVEQQLGARMAGWRMDTRVVDAEECRHTLECTTWDHYALVLDALASGYRAVGSEADANRVHATAVELSPWLWE